MVASRSSVVVGAFALLHACAAPDQPTDLRTSGPPNVTTVLVASDLRTSIDPSGGDLDRFLESATYCRLGDEKRPDVVDLPTMTTVAVCPDDLDAPAEADGVAEAAPPSWYVRVVFDQLLDPAIEDLVPELDAMMHPTGRMMGTLAVTQPVTLTCGGVDVPYDGNYVPNGNRVSWPVGPSLYIQPLSSTAVATGASCTVTIKDSVHNKRGTSVPSAQRSYMFQLAAMALRFSAPDPADGDPGTLAITPEAPVSFFWTAPIATLPAASDIQIFTAPNVGAAGTEPDLTVCDAGGTEVASEDFVLAVRAPAEGATAATTAATTALVLELGLASADPGRWAPSTTYRIEVGPGARVSPAQGGPDGTFPAGYKLCFHTTRAAM